MSKSLKRVTAALADLGLDRAPRQLDESTRTAADAARALGCCEDQIAKSVIFRGADSDRVHLFITAGGRQVDPARAAALAGEPLAPADAAFVRAQTGFAIGGVSPIGHLTPPQAFFDAALMGFDIVWAAAGTPRHVFSARPSALCQAANARLGEFSHRAGEKM